MVRALVGKHDQAVGIMLGNDTEIIELSILIHLLVFKGVSVVSRATRVQVFHG